MRLLTAACLFEYAAGSNDTISGRDVLKFF